MKSEENRVFNLFFLRPKKAAGTETRMEKRWRLILDGSRRNVFQRIKHRKGRENQKGSDVGPLSDQC